jgi:hypothetical protein
MFTGKSKTCGTTLPDLQLNLIGGVVAGANKVQIQLPSSVWNAPSMPTYASTGSQMGWGPPNTFQIDPTLALIGLQVPSGTDGANFTWPKAAGVGGNGFPTGTTFPDDDGDMNPGITATPLSMTGYADPPTSISGQPADELYLATRTQMQFAGTWSSCTDLSGTVTVTHFDNHVVGCHVKGGATCTTAQSNFIDSSRTVYVPGMSTFVAKALPSTATCADVLTALP